MHLLLAVAPSVATTFTATAAAATSAAAATQSIVPTAVASFVETTVPSIVASILPPGVTTAAPGAITAPLALVPPPFELAATFVGAVSGSLVAVRKRFDIIGVLTLALVAGLGGGIIRDVLLQKYGIAAFQHDYLLLTAIVAALVGFFFASAIHQGRSIFLLVDAVSLALFAIVGADKAVVAALGIIPAILLGTITSTGGGVLRDVLTGEVPNVLQPGSLYAAAAVAGSSTYILLLVWLGVVKPVAAGAAIIVVLGLRLASVWLGWQTPTPVDSRPGSRATSPTGCAGSLAAWASASRRSRRPRARDGRSPPTSPRSTLPRGRRATTRRPRSPPNRRPGKHSPAASRRRPGEETRCRPFCSSWS